MTFAVRNRANSPMVLASLTMNMKFMKLAIFDFDGTLANTFPLFVDTLGDLAERHNFRMPLQTDVDKLRGSSANEILRELQLPLWRVPKVLADFRDIMRQRIDEIRPFDGIVDVLQTLADQKITLAVATSNSLNNVEAVLGHAMISRFAALECGATLFGKARRLRRVLQATQMEKANAIYIGDEIRDADAARKIGIPFGAVAWGYTDLRAMLPLQPDAIFKTPQDLLTLANPPKRSAAD
jgi:phosphoglycolate phosphatase